MRGEDHVGQVVQGAGGRQRFGVGHIEDGVQAVAAGVLKCGVVDQGAAGGVDEYRAGGQCGELRGRDHVVGPRQRRRMQAHHVGLRRHLVQQGWFGCPPRWSRPDRRPDRRPVPGRGRGRASRWVTRLPMREKPTTTTVRSQPLRSPMPSRFVQVLAENRRRKSGEEGRLLERPTAPGERVLGDGVGVGVGGRGRRGGLGRMRRPVHGRVRGPPRAGRRAVAARPATPVHPQRRTAPMR